jgi:BON domain
MKAKTLATAPILALALSMALATGCSSDKLSFGSRSDAQIASDIQNKINSDNALTNKQVTIKSENGIITLSGTAATEAERQVAGYDAGQVAGVKTVINDLQVMTAQQAPPPSDQMAQNYPPPAPTVRRRRTTSASNRSRGYSNPGNSTQSDLGSSDSSSNAMSSAPAMAAAPVAPVTVTVPDGTAIGIRLIDSLSTERNHVGDTFKASLDTPLVADNDRLAVPANADVEGRVVAVQPSTHFSGHSELTLQLTSITFGGKTYPISTNQWQKLGQGRGKRTAETVGGGAVLGAIIGGLAGGGKGAAIGAGAGAGTGGAVQGVTHGEAVRLETETRLDFRLAAPLTVTPGSSQTNRTKAQLP